MPRAAALAAYRDPAEVLAAIEAELARRTGSRTFSAFVKQAWQYAPSVDPLVWGWHLDAMCSHLEEVAHGRIPKLLINCPPGHAKSVLLSVLWPAWIWTWWPRAQFLFGSYATELSVRDSVRCRAVIESDWYHDNFSGPAGWRLRTDQNAKHWFINTVGGERQAVGVGGTGRRAHIIGIDDPIDVVQVWSKAERDRANAWIGQTLSQRFVDAKQPKVAMIMQRSHEEDPSAFVLSGGDWQHLRMPAEYDPTRPTVTYHWMQRANGHVSIEREEFWRDPRTQRNELLFPEKFPREVLDAFKRPNALGLDGYASQQNQDPTPPSGGMFKRADWRFWKANGHLPDLQNMRPNGCDQGPAYVMPPLEVIILSVDAAFKDNPSGSQVAIHIWGRAGGDFFLLYRFTEHLDFAATKQEIRNALASRFGRQVGAKLVEDKANGSAIISDLRHEIPGFEAVEPEGGKESRAAVAQPYQRSHNCYLPDGEPWLDDFIVKTSSFPKGRYADDIDAYSQAMRKLAVPDLVEQGTIDWHRR